MMLALIVVGSFLLYVAGALITSYLLGKWEFSEEGRIFGTIGWPFGLLVGFAMIFAERGEKGEPFFGNKPKKVFPACRCNGGTNPCPIPPKEGAYR
jgi:hypothetical protein